MKTEPNEPINPSITREPVHYGDGTAVAMLPEFQNVYHTGLTKREYFAATAMQGLLASLTLSSIPVGTKIQMAVEVADALIVELNKEGRI